MRLAAAVSILALCVLTTSCGPKAADAASHDAHGEAAHTAHGEAAHEQHAALAVGHGPASAAHGGAHEAAHWSYNDQSAWGALAAENSACAVGHEQSPINLSGGAPAAELPDLVQRYLPSEGAWVNNGHTLQFTPAGDGSVLMIGQDAYTLAQFHFHSPSEHLMDRRAYPLELHFVHKNSQGRLAVVGVFIEEGPENEALAALVAAAPAQTGDAHGAHVALNPHALLPADRTYYAYAGSLTTPPCSEGVRWNVMRAPITASAAQIAALRERLGASSRHPQALNERTVLMGL